MIQEYKVYHTFITLPILLYYHYLLVDCGVLYIRMKFKIVKMHEMHIINAKYN